MAPPSPLRVLLVADDALARAGLRAVAEAAGLDVVAEEGPDPSQGEAEERQPDAVVWDLGGSDSFDRIRSVAERLPVVAVLGREEQAREALAAGVRAVLLRDHVGERLGASVQAAAAGLLVVDEALRELVLRPPAVAAPALVESLTPREQEVLRLVAEGLTNRRIGERLGISEHTVKFHVNSILGKLGAQTRGEAIALGARLGLLPL
jgi:two-component system, NarL family, nitrate/nitrite response regulator NarL